MLEKEILQSILRNCNPRLVSLLRGTVRDVGELVRTGTQVEKYLEESKRYWNNVNAEAQRKKLQLNREGSRFKVLVYLSHTQSYRV